MSQEFPKLHRIRKRREFREVYETGAPYRNAGFHLFVRGREQDLPTRLGLTVTKAAGPSVDRNRLRRWAREVFRTEYGRLSSGYDLVVNIHRRMADVPREEFDRLLFHVWQKAHLFEKGEARVGPGDESGLSCGR
jgi:ribonuclease P protein component